MAINKNHEFEELDGIKCSIVERNASPERVEFLKKILQYNQFTVVVTPSPAPKPTVAPKPPEGEVAPVTTLESPEGPPSFTVGVTDVGFNPTNAIFGRLLKTPDGKIVTLSYWQQKEVISNDEIPYFDRKTD